MALAGFYDRYILPRVITLACGQEAIEDRRRKVVPLASGRVFELGCGGGLNQPYYSTEKVSSLSGIDPNARLLDAARQSADARGWEVDLQEGVGEDIPFATGSFDTVVCTYTLCSVANPVRVVAEMRRILKPGGQLLFLEHGRAPDPDIFGWQKRVEPFWKPFSGGCHLSRPVGGTLRAGGFEVEPLGQGYLEKAPKIMGWMEWGVARKWGV